MLPLSGLRALTGRYDAVLSDVWGVVHNGVAAHPSAVEALANFRAAGGPGGADHQRAAPGAADRRACSTGSACRATPMMPSSRRAT
jgi:hypothetical protein